ncbi:MAG: response regulator [Microcoleaceae cyanobacterium]
MDSGTPELVEVKQQLMTLNRPKKPKMLVVDDEPDNLDLLYRTFRRNFNVFKADSGIQALDVLKTEGEVAVIISDQRMPEMKGTEFLSKTVPEFPNTVRIILTGFTDIEDLVEAINSGQVYKYITKPWDPNELKSVVQRAAETYELLNQRTEELQRAHKQAHLLCQILQLAQAVTTLEDGLTPIAEAIGRNFDADVCILQAVENQTLSKICGVYSLEGSAENWLATDPLVASAMASMTIQAVVNVSREKNLSQLEHYQSSGIQAHLSIPVIYKDKMTGILSLQWKQPCQLHPDDLDSLNLVSQTLALALISLR